MINRSKLEQIKKWNRTGEFHRSIQALQEAVAIPADIRSEVGCQEGFDTLYLYVEAQLYSGHAEEAEAHYPALQSLLYTWNGIYNHSYTANYHRISFGQRWISAGEQACSRARLRQADGVWRTA